MSEIHETDSQSLLDLTINLENNKFVTSMPSRNMHTKDVEHIQKLVHIIDWEHHWQLPIAWPHRPLCFKKVRTTTITTFLISKTVVSKPGSYSTAFDSQSLTPLHPSSPSQVRLIDLPVWYSSILWLSIRQWYSTVYKQQVNWNFLEQVRGPWSDS